MASDAIELELERRRRALQEEIAAGGALLADDVATLAGACAHDHPLLYLGGGVAAGAWIARSASPSGAVGLFGGLVRAASGALRFLPGGILRSR